MVNLKKSIVAELDACIELLEHKMTPLQKSKKGVIVCKKKDKLYEAKILECKDFIENIRDKQTKAFFKDILAKLYKGKMSESDFMNYFDEYLGSGLAKYLTKPLYKWSESVIKLGISETPKPPSVKLSYNIVDKNIAELMNNQNIFFIGEYYNHANGNVTLKDIENVFAQSLSRGETADKILSFIEDDQIKWKSYMDGFVEHAASRLRNVGNITGYEKAGIKYAEVFAILDDRTTDICREMNGRLIPVDYMTEIKEEFLSIDTKGRSVEDVKNDLKELVPFWTNKDTNIIKGHSTNDILNAYPGLTLPPYHWRCRTETVAFFEEEETPIEYDVGSDVSPETKNYIKALTNKDFKNKHQELDNKIRALDSIKTHIYEPKDLKTDGNHILKFEKILGKPLSDDDYIEIGRSFIKNYKYKGFRVYKNRGDKETDFQLYYFAKGGYTVVGSNGNIRGVYHANDIEKKLANDKTFCIIK
jgi:SPP1 gp7 family putative phage head morphogenesis protein